MIVRNKFHHRKINKFRKEQLARCYCYLLVKILYNQYANMTPKDKA